MSMHRNCSMHGTLRRIVLVLRSGFHVALDKNATESSHVRALCQEWDLENEAYHCDCFILCAGEKCRDNVTATCQERSTIMSSTTALGFCQFQRCRTDADALISCSKAHRCWQSELPDSERVPSISIHQLFVEVEAGIDDVERRGNLKSELMFDATTT